MNFFFTLVDVCLITDSFGFTILKGKHYNITASKNHTIKKRNLTGHFEPTNFFFKNLPLTTPDITNQLRYVPKRKNRYGILEGKKLTGTEY